MIGVFVLRFCSLYVIMTMFLLSSLLVFYFCLFVCLFFSLILEVVSPRSTLVVHPSDLSLNGVLVPLELLLCRVGSSAYATESLSTTVELVVALGPRLGKFHQLSGSC